ncbi:MAG: Hsp20/alpha crystallin family protein, partial [Patescibacteria group bacterium]
RRERKEEVKEKDYFYQELFWGAFSRSIILPQEVDPENSTAVLKNGILTIRMPKMNRQRSKKLRVGLD